MASLCGYMRKVSMRIALSQLASDVYDRPPLRLRAMFVRMTQRLQKTPEYRTVLRRGVVCLLVLVCIATGCARSTAQNQSSSPRVRQSTPPRSKAKAPVTTVRPKATPQPPASPTTARRRTGGESFLAWCCADDASSRLLQGQRRWCAPCARMHMWDVRKANGVGRVHRRFRAQHPGHRAGM